MLYGLPCVGITVPPDLNKNLKLFFFWKVFSNLLTHPPTPQCVKGGGGDQRNDFDETFAPKGPV